MRHPFTILLISAALASTALSGCGWGSGGGDDAGGGSGRSAPGRPQPAPIDSDLAKMPTRTIQEIHRELREAAADVSAENWPVLSGARLFTIVQRHLNLSDSAWDSELTLRLFARLHQLLHDDDGHVRENVDAKAVVRALQKEYFKPDSGGNHD
jgi:hypothetical protein